jgi:hypothetical protein
VWRGDGLGGCVVGRNLVEVLDQVWCVVGGDLGWEAGRTWKDPGGQSANGRTTLGKCRTRVAWDQCASGEGVLG